MEKRPYTSLKNMMDYGYAVVEILIETTKRSVTLVDVNAKKYSISILIRYFLK